jgi:hypothetical protein
VHNSGFKSYENIESKDTHSKVAPAEACRGLTFLALRNITKKWKNPTLTWKLADHPIRHPIWTTILGD